MDSIDKFLQVSSGNGYGSGNGNGYGNGDGSGSGYGNGYGNGYGSGNGSGNGYGNGYGSGNGYGNDDGSGSGNGYGNGLVEIYGHKVHNVDGIQTIIHSVKGSHAKGEVVNNDLTTRPVYIAKRGNHFAHGSTLKKAVADAERKYQDNLPVEDRIANFKEAVKGLDKIPAQTLYDWHTTLTGSCEFGKEQFIKDKGIDLSSSYSLEEFISLTKDSYGGDIIKQLKHK